MHPDLTLPPNQDGPAAPHELPDFETSWMVWAPIWRAGPHAARPVQGTATCSTQEGLSATSRRLHGHAGLGWGEGLGPGQVQMQSNALQQGVCPPPHDLQTHNPLARPPAASVQVTMPPLTVIPCTLVPTSLL